GGAARRRPPAGLGGEGPGAPADRRPPPAQPLRRHLHPAPAARRPACLTGPASHSPVRPGRLTGPSRRALGHQGLRPSLVIMTSFVVVGATTTREGVMKAGTIRYPVGTERLPDVRRIRTGRTGVHHPCSPATTRK